MDLRDLLLQTLWGDDPEIDDILDFNLSFYDTQPFLSTEQTEGQKMRSGYWCQGLDDERGYWAAVRKLGD